MFALQLQRRNADRFVGNCSNSSAQRVTGLENFGRADRLIHRQLAAGECSRVFGDRTSPSANIAHFAVSWSHCTPRNAPLSIVEECKFHSLPACSPSYKEMPAASSIKLTGVSVFGAVFSVQLFPTMLHVVPFFFPSK